MPSKTLTAPLAIVKKNGVAVANIRSFNIQESFQRASVQGLGSLTRTEVPPVVVTCSASFDFYLVNFRPNTAISDAVKRGANSLEEFVNNFLFTDGVQIDVYKKVAGATNAQGLIGADLELVGTIKEMFIESDSMSLSEGSIGSRSQSFQYLEPILYKD